MKSTQHRDPENLPTKLERIERRSKQDRKAVFDNLGHLLDLKLLWECFHSLDGKRAVGIDGVTKEKYGQDLEDNLRKLLIGIRQGSYHPKASRIVEIPKLDGGKRPLAIACLEDKIVQEAVRRILERIYEPIFLESSHGFRPGRGSDSALYALNGHLMSWKCGGILEIDLQKYFGTIPHDRLIQLLKLKVKDQRFLYLIIRLLKSPVLDAEGKATRSEIGSPQGSILSPLLANIFLHYVLDIWFSWRNEKSYGGVARMIRYADDAVFTFRNLSEAEKCRAELTVRLESFGISIHEAKTKTLVCGQREADRREVRREKMPTFTFLGFLHLWGVSVRRSNGKRFWRVKRRTCPVRYRKKLLELKEFIRVNRHHKLLIPMTISRVRGYLGYFAINDNLKRCAQFLNEVKRLLYKWLNRRSQKRSFDWIKFNLILKRYRFPEKIYARPLFFDSKLNRVHRFV